MSDNGRVSLLFLCHVLLYFGTGMGNNLLAGFSLYLHLDALLVLFFGLYLKRASGLVFTVLLALLAESIRPVPPGTCLLGYVGLWSFFVWSQRRIRLQNPLHVRFIAAAGQFLWMVLQAGFLGRHQLGEILYWQRMLVDSASSLVVIYFLAWPWCSLQKKVLHSLGWDLDAQLSGP